MVRPRSEQPSESEPVGGDDERVKKRRRKRGDEERDEPAEMPVEAEKESRTDDQAEPSEPVGPEAAPEDPERLRREVAAEIAFRERVTLAELAGRLSSESYAALERALAGQTEEWWLERGRYVFTFLLRERPVASSRGTARVEQKLALDRDEPPVPPERVDRLVADVVGPDEPTEEMVRRLAPLRAELPAGDEIRIRTTPDRPEIVVTAEAVTVAPTPEESMEAGAEIIETIPAPPAPEPGPPRSDIDRLVAEVEREPEEEPAAGTVTRPVGERDVPATAEPSSDRPVPRDTPESASSGVLDLAGALRLLDREAVDLNDLPPIRGGAPEPGEPLSPETDGVPPEPPDLSLEQLGQPPEQPPEPSVPPDTETVLSGGPPEPRPPSRGRRRHRPQSRRGREILRWDPDTAEVVRYPDHAMRRKARKLVRRMAAEYGLKLTPQVEAYLLGLVLRPHLIGGRRVYSIGLNIETLISVVQVLKYNFNITRRPPA